MAFSIVLIMRCASLCVLGFLWQLVNRPISALNCLLQLEQVSSDNDYSDDDPLALDSRSLRFRSASQTLFAS